MRFAQPDTLVTEGQMAWREATQQLAEAISSGNRLFLRPVRERDGSR
jgi:hypothetical protein